MAFSVRQKGVDDDSSLLVLSLLESPTPKMGLLVKI